MMDGNALVIIPAAEAPVPALVTAAGERASVRLVEFFAANIGSPHMRRAYYRAADKFLAWCACRTSPCTLKDTWQSWTSIR
jgi:hypothetical protein